MLIKKKSGQKLVPGPLNLYLWFKKEPFIYIYLTGMALFSEWRNYDLMKNMEFTIQETFFGHELYSRGRFHQRFRARFSQNVTRKKTFV